MATLIGSAAYAQPSGQTPGEQTTPPTGPTLAEVIVTAERREESLVQVPISVTAVSAEQLNRADIRDVAGLQKIVPGFSMTFAGANSQPVIRGVGTAVAGPGLPSNVAIYQDGFYQPNAIANNVNFPDIESVQVLKGPQGELYGQNATGGAVLVTTRPPLFTPHADLDLSYRRFDDFREGVFVTGPITSNLAASISAFGRQWNGFNTNLVTGEEGLHANQWGVRAKLLFKPTDDLSFTLAVQHIYTKDPNTFVFDNYQGISVGALIPGAIVANGTPYQYSNDFRPSFKSRFTDISLKAVWQLPWATLTTLAHTQWQRNYSAYDVDASSAPLEHVDFPGNDRNSSLEFDLTSKPGDPVQWLAGLFLFHDNGFEYLDLLSPPGPFEVVEGGVKTDSVAVFGDITWEAVNHLYLTAGLRYSTDWLKERFAAAPNFEYLFANTSFHSLTPRFVARYEISDNSSVYASYSAGYKTGGYNANGLSTVPVRPERIDAYELGYKHSARNWQLQASGFYYVYKDLQVSAYQGPVTTLVNAARAHIYGAELSGSVLPLPRLTLGGGVAYTHAEYKSFPGAPMYTWSPLTGITVAPGDASGNPLVYSPEWSVKMNANYVYPIPVGSLEFNASFLWESTIYFDAFKFIKQKPYEVLDLRATWISPSRKWDVSVFANNVTDRAYISEAFQQPVAFSERFAPPRTVGVELRAHL